MKRGPGFYNIVIAISLTFQIITIYYFYLIYINLKFKQ
jgi:hypothetical protein